jgi:hypothetical protein
LRGETSDGKPEEPRPWQECCKEDPHRWASDLAVYAEFSLNPARVQRLQVDKDRLHTDLEAVADCWKGESNSFKEDVNREAACYGNALIKAYRELAGGRDQIAAMMPPEMKKAFHAAFGPRKFDPRTPPGMQPGVKLCHWLASEAHYARPDDPDPVAIVEQFFRSKHATEVPFQYIVSRLWATIAQMVRSPKGPRSPKPSDNYDVTAIAHYAPYCDAMVVDNEFCAMASQKNVDVPRKFGVRLFCPKTLDKFLDYLDDLVANIPHDQRVSMQQVYPHLAGLAWLNVEAATNSVHEPNT